MRSVMVGSILATVFCVCGLSQPLAAPPATAPTARPYQAQWIWATVESPKPFQFVRFRKTIELAAKPDAATAYITADTFYRLWINDRLVMHGPARSSRGKAAVDPIPVEPYLVQGKNAVMIEVFHGICPFEALAQAPGLLCEVEATVHGKKEILAATDAAWDAAEITAWNRDSLRFSYQRGWIEQFDGRRTLQENWRPAIVLGPVGTAPWKTVEMRDVPLPAPLLPMRPTRVVNVQRSDGGVIDIEPVERFDLDGVTRPEWNRRSEWFRRLEGERLRNDDAAAANPAGVTSNGDGDTVLNGDGASITYDLGQAYVGFLGFDLSGRDGQSLEIAWSSRLSGDGLVRPRAQTGNNALRYDLRDGQQAFLAFTPQFARFVRVVQRGPGRLTLHRLGLTEFRFAAEPKGSFRCSDEAVNRIYDAARRTAMLTMLDAYMDCPHRERNAMYTLEAYWMLKGVYPMFGDTSVSRRSVIYGADSVDDPDRTGPPGMVQLAYPMHLKFFSGVIPVGPFFWILHAGLYEQYSGDTELIRTMLPLIRRNAEVFDDWRNADGLLESIPSWTFFGYVDIRADGVSVALNALHAKALDEAARLERLVGDPARAAEFAKRATQVRDALNRYCTGETFYSDVLYRNDKNELVPSHEKCETTQYYAMWADVPPPDRMRKLWSALRDDFVPSPRTDASPIHFSPANLTRLPPKNGVARSGLYPFPERCETAARLGDHAAVLRDVKLMFSPMVENPPGTLWEDPMGEIALCHSIGCGVGGLLTEEILGIGLGSPLKIAPHSGGSLQWCRGHLTTPQGRIEVAWSCRKERYELAVSIPKRMTAEVLLPPEAKAVWQSKPAATPWPVSVQVKGPATVMVLPGRVDIVPQFNAQSALKPASSR